MRDFDQARAERIAGREERWAEKDRSFTIGGEQFRYRLSIPFRVPAMIASVTVATEDSSLIRAIDEALPQMIEPDEGWEEKWERAKDVMEYVDAQQLCFWIISELTERPTEASVPSGNGRTPTGENSTEASSSEAEASAA